MKVIVWSLSKLRRIKCDIWTEIPHFVFFLVFVAQRSKKLKCIWYDIYEFVECMKEFVIFRLNKLCLPMCFDIQDRIPHRHRIQSRMTHPSVGFWPDSGWSALEDCPFSVIERTLWTLTFATYRWTNYLLFGTDSCLWQIKNNLQVGFRWKGKTISMKLITFRFELRFQEELYVCLFAVYFVWLLIY